jgi:hypothetical protein
MDKLQIPKLVGRSNWVVWKRQIVSALEFHNFDDILTGTLTKPPVLAAGASADDIAAHEAAVLKYKKANAYATNLLLLSVDPEPLRQIEAVSTARDMWTKLCTSFEKPSDQRLELLYRELLEFQYVPGDTVSSHIAKLKRIWGELQTESQRVDKCDLPQTLLLVRVLNTLPSSYREFSTVWESVPRAQRTVEYLEERLNMLELRLREPTASECTVLLTKSNVHRPESVVRQPSGSAPQSNRRKDYSKFKCHLCGEMGHIKYKCPSAPVSTSSPPLSTNSVSAGSLHPVVSAPASSPAPSSHSAASASDCYI